MVIASLGIALLAFVSPVNKVYAEEYAVVGISDDGEAEVGTEYSLGDSAKGIVSADGTTITISGTGTINKSAAAVGIDTSLLTTVIFEDGITSIVSPLFQNCTSLTGTLELPNTLTFIGHSTFAGCTGFTGDLIIPDSVTYIEQYAFSGCTGFNGDLVISESVTEIGRGAFYRCTGFKNLYLEEGIQKLGMEVFRECKFSNELVIPDSMLEIGSYAFSYCYDIPSLDLGNGVTLVGDCAFIKCTGLEGTLIIPDSVTTLGKNAFERCTGFTSLKLGNGLTKITGGNWGGETTTYGAFQYCTGLKGAIVIPDSVTAIENYAFKGCSGISEIKIGQNVTTIGDSAFYGCSNLQGVLNIPDSVTTIGAKAFYGADSINMIKNGENITSLGAGAFYATVSVDTSVMTTNELLKTYDWAGSNRVYIEVSPENFHGVSMTGGVSPITTIDVTLPLNGLSFAIDENRNFSAQTSVIQNNCNCPIDVYLLDISKSSNEPDVVAENTYTEKEWNNLSKADTLSKIALKVNDQELFTIFNNSERDGDLALKVGSIKSGFSSTEELELTPGAQYGKNFGNKELIKFQYDLVFEFRVP